MPKYSWSQLCDREKRPEMSEELNQSLDEMCQLADPAEARGMLRESCSKVCPEGADNVYCQEICADVPDDKVQDELAALVSRLKRVADSHDLSASCGRLCKTLNSIGLTKKAAADAFGDVFREMIAMAKRHGVALTGSCSAWCGDCDDTKHCRCGCS